MEEDTHSLLQKIEELTKENTELRAFKQEYSSSKQSLSRMSTRLRKLCKKLTPEGDTVVEMQKLAEEIRELSRQVTGD